MKRPLLFSLVLAAGLMGSRAHAQPAADKAMARSLGEQGTAALDAKDYAKALDLFTRATKLYHAPTLSLGLARAQAGSGKLVAAFETYNAMVREGPGASPSPAFAEAVEGARKEAAALEPRLGKVVLSVTGPKDPQITMDGDAFPTAALGLERPIDPGQHEVKVAAAGFDPATQQFSVPESKTQTVALTLKPSAAASAPVAGPAAAAPLAASAAAAPPPSPPPAPSSTQRTIGWAVAGVGAAGLAVGGVTGVLAITTKGTLDNDCAGKPVCPPSAKSTHDTYELVTALSTATFIGGGVLAAAGATLVLTSPKVGEPKTGSLEPWIGVGSAGLKGSF